MGKMLHSDWKQWPTSRPEWMHEEIEEAFERFVEQKMEGCPQHTVVVHEPVSWEIPGTKQEKPMATKQLGNPKKA